ncbi:MAG: putative molybdenum carrier protein [Deltaproteobacteria bacterium]|nr:putative molybdenum carrier protein [Candidatus Tharpella sp.]
MVQREEDLEAYNVKKIVSGGQTGVDRAALDVAMELNIPVGGWCPKGRNAEDGPIDAKYPLKETNSSDYEIRTMFNARDSNGTLILSKGKPSGGTALTIKFAKGFDKSYLVIDLDQNYDLESVKVWLFEHCIDVLNVAGPRASKFPGMYDQAKRFLEGLLESMVPESTSRT